MTETDANINLNAILWLKSELDKTLSDARSALDHYVDNPADTKSAKEALALYKLAYGVLKMARIRGGELLLQELIAVMEELLSGRLRRRDDALDTVMQATAQLPDYLEYLQAGHADVPIVLLPLLNDMRASRDAELLSDSILELTELSNDSQFYTNRKSSGESVPKLAKGLHGIFQKALLDWYQERDSSNNLLKLAAIFFRLGNACKGVNSRRLWLVSQSVVEAIQCGDLETSIAVKSLLGKVDRQMKTLINTDEEEFDRSIPLELVKNLLFYVAAANSGNKTVDRVKEVYKLNELLPDGGSIETARANLRGAGKNIYRSLTKAVGDEINGIKERLEVYAFADRPRVDMLTPVVGKLKSLAETVGMLGRSAEREDLLQASKRLDTALTAESVLTREEIQELASLLVDIEISVKGFVGEKNSNGESKVHEQEYRKVYHAVVQETLAELGKVRATTLDYLDRYKNHDLLAPLPGLLKNIRGALAILPLMAVEPLLSKLDGFIAGLITKKHQPTDEQLSAFADGLSSIEFYLESLEPGIGDQKNILEIGKASLAQLDAFIIAEETAPAESALVESVMAETVMSGSAASVSKNIRSDTIDMAELLEMDAMDTAAEEDIADDDVENTVVVERMEILADEPATSEVAGIEHETPLLVPQSNDETSQHRFAELQVLPTTVDQEILEIFLEEASDEQQKIASSLEHWIADTADMDALAIIRRAFHTLKGSGRLVGAEVIGEFAWSFEKLLNRVMDGSVAPTVEVFATLEAARDLLPGLVAQISTREKPEDAVATAARHADILVRGESLDSLQDRQREMPADLTIIVDPEDEEESPASQLRNTVDTNVDDAAKVDLREDALSKTGLEKFPTLGMDATNELLALKDSEIDSETLEPIVEDTVNIRSVILAEVEEQLEYIDAQVQKVTEYDSELNADAELLNSIQTLNNVARTADIPNIYNVFSDVEDYLEYCANHDRKLAKSFAGLLGQASQHANEVLGSLRAGVPMPADNEDAIRALKNLLDSARIIAEEELQLTQRQVQEEIEQEKTLNVEVLDIADQTLSDSIESIAANVSEPIMEAQSFDQQTPDIINAKDAEITGIFLEEAREILDISDSLTSSWIDHVNDNILIKELQRHLHTLKGGARMAGLDNIGNLAHSIESVFDSLVENKIDGTAEVVHLVQTSYDMLGTMISAAENGQPIFPANGLQQDIQDIVAPNNQPQSGQKPQVHQAPNVGTPSFIAAETQVTDPYDEIEEVQPELESEPTPIIIGEQEIEQAPADILEEYTSVDVLTSQTLTGSTNSPSATSATNERLVNQDSIKVNALLLDELVNQAGEINIFHSRIDEQIKQTSSRLEELQQTIVRLSAQLRSLENEAEAQILSTFKKDEKFDPDLSTIREDFDPLELDRYSTIQQLSRSLAESISDLTSLEEIVSGNLKDLETLLLQKSRISTDLQEGLMRTRLVPFSIQLPRFKRVVRRTANELNKEVELVISGENSELDRKLLDSMISPLEHFLRNSIAHGIELPEERLAAGKNRAGKIEINIKRNGPEIELLVSDDGAGIDLDKVRERAIAAKLLAPDAELSDEEVLQFILESGLSTASSVDQISGRGVGLDVVNHEIKKLNGDLRIASERGVGTTFRINLPFTLAINQSLMIQAADDVFAVPVTSIYGVIRMQPEKIAVQLALEEPIIDYGGTTYALQHLGSTLNRKVIPMNTTEEQLPLLLVNTGEYRVAFLVDAVLGSREIVVKPLGPPLNSLVEYSGATIMGDGNVALILDMPGVVRTSSTGKSQLTKTGTIQPERPLVMVVDDSITIRKVTTRILERHDYQVITAKDGVDAQRKLTDFVPAVILLDVEMPRMDGFELATKLRQSKEHQHVPIIMITSRTGKKHKERAAKIGVNRYLGKPFQEEKLLQEIKTLIASEDVVS